MKTPMRLTQIGHITERFHTSPIQWSGEGCSSCDWMVVTMATDPQSMISCGSFPNEDLGLSRRSCIDLKNITVKLHLVLSVQELDSWLVQISLSTLLEPPVDSKQLCNNERALELLFSAVVGMHSNSGESTFTVQSMKGSKERQVLHPTWHSSAKEKLVIYLAALYVTS